MMRAKADPKAASNTVLLLACVLLAGSAIAGLLMPKPLSADERKKAETQRLDQTTAIGRAKTLEAAARTAVLARTWTGADAAITSAVLDLTTTLARKRGVSFIRLQPQRNVVGGSLDQLPYLVVVEGSFPAIAAMEKDLEVPQNRLAVNSFQIASSDSETNKVSASISVVAHRLAADVEETEVKNGKGG